MVHGSNVEQAAMTTFLRITKSILTDARGATAIEYALIASAFGLGTAAAMPLLTSNMNETYSRIVGYFDASMN